MYAIAICWLNARTQKRTDFLCTILFFVKESNGVSKSDSQHCPLWAIVIGKAWTILRKYQRRSKSWDRVTAKIRRKKIRIIVVMVVVSHQSPGKRKKLYHIIQSVVWMGDVWACVYILYRDCSNRRLVAGLPSTFVFLARIKTVWVRFGFGVFCDFVMWHFRLIQFVWHWLHGYLGI